MTDAPSAFDREPSSHSVVEHSPNLTFSETSSPASKLAEDTSSMKRKKLPACDYCKARRVICHPQPDGKPCPRCEEKDVTCITTPTVRRRRRTRKEIQEERERNAQSRVPCAKSSPSSVPFGGSPQSRPAVAIATTGPALSSFAAQAILSWRDANPLPGPLVTELIKLFPTVPQSLLFSIPYRRLCSKLENCGWDLALLDAPTHFLASCILALTARISTHPMLIGTDVSDPRVLRFLASGNLAVTPGLDLRGLGRARDAQCKRLYDEACRLATETGVSMVPTEESAAAYYILDFLESSTTPYDCSLTWTALMMWHVRRVAESDDHHDLFRDSYRRLHWPIQLLNCALICLCFGRSFPFTEHDERLICGPAPDALEAATITLSHGPITLQAIGEFIYPYLSHAIRLARESSEGLVGPQLPAYARRFPLNEAALVAHVSDVECLQRACDLLHDCVETIIPRAKRGWVPAALANGLFVTSVAVPSILVPLHRALKRRLAEGSIPTLQTGFGGDGGGPGQGGGQYASDAAKRIRALHWKVTERTRDLPSITYMTHLQCSRWISWIELAAEECEPMDMTPLERYKMLDRIVTIMRIDGFAWVERFGTVNYIKEAMTRLEGQQQLALHRKHPGVSSTWLSYTGKARNGAAYERGHATFGRSPAPSAVYEGRPAYSPTLHNYPSGSSASHSLNPSGTTSMGGMLESESQMLDQALLGPTVTSPADLDSSSSPSNTSDMAQNVSKNAAHAAATVRRRKKPPACDYCKARRVICHPQPDGKSCPRCIEKGVECTTTPTVRRKRRTREQIEADEAASLAAASTSIHFANSSRPEGMSGCGSASGSSAASSPSALLSWRDAHPIPLPLIEELIKLFPMVPQSLLFVGPYRRLCDTLEAYEWDLSRLDAHARVLAYCVMAVTARISTHPMFIGADVTDALVLQFLSSGNLAITPGLDLRELGRNRNAFCRDLYDEACKVAFSTGVSVISSEETAAACYLLDFLESCALRSRFLVLTHVIHLARQSSERLIGPHARRFPLDEAVLFNHISAVEALQSICSILHNCIEAAIPKAQRGWVRPALANGLFVTGLAVPSLLVPLHKDLKRRLAEGSIEVPQSDPNSAGGCYPDTASQARERIGSLHRKVRVMALQALSQAMERTRDLPGITYMTHLQCSRWAAWIKLTVDECDPTDISPLERYKMLERMATIIKLDGFAWVDRSGALFPVKAKMDDLYAQQQLVLSRRDSGVPSPWPGGLQITQDEEISGRDDINNGGSRRPSESAVLGDAQDLLGQSYSSTDVALDLFSTANVGVTPGDAHFLQQAFF
uniref:Zn(2)-C6 fungal-type domain-containing protein n=1 Tax=Schizophyllum commune (strain H4-8 / FGSC 9210) TaxID=578458 RepID=D8Q2G5_SCHCM